ncbi:short-chain fatty acid transporter [Halocola ammonii]
MNFSDRFIYTFRRLLPSPFTIAILLTVFTFLIALFFTRTADQGVGSYALEIAGYWQEGLWNSNLMVFAMQMMLILVLGHALALTPAVSRVIDYFTDNYCTSTGKAAFWITFLTVMVALFNWGLGLIFGAVFARKVAESARKKKMGLNYPLLGAAGYSGLMVWHGGFSGSSLVKVADNGHIRELMRDNSQSMTADQIAQLPEAITYTETVFGTMNLSLSFALLLILPTAMYWLGNRLSPQPFSLPKGEGAQTEIEEETVGAEKIDRSKWSGLLFGILFLGVAGYTAVSDPGFAELKFITPNYLNFLLLGLGLLFHRSFKSFLSAVDDAIGGAAGILIQFPLYFGIMAIMNHSGMVEQISGWFVEICKDSSSPETLYPILTFFSAGLVNIFVPSGGGQWAVQGPIIVQAATDMGVPLTKSIMALAYGDQITNMLQPFWALPLLGITGLKARDILPFTLFLLVLGLVIFIGGLLIF